MKLTKGNTSQLITAVWRYSWFCLFWKIRWIFQFDFSIIFFLKLPLHRQAGER